MDAQPRFELTDREREVARGAIDEIRPLMNELTSKFLDFAYEFDGDDERSFIAIVKYVEVAIEVGRFDRNTMIALLAFGVRRLHSNTPRMVYATPN